MSEDPAVVMWRQAAYDQRRRAVADERERVADGLDALAAKYPESVFAPGSASPDGIAGTAMRHAYRTAARLVREHGLPGDEDEPDAPTPTEGRRGVRDGPDVKAVAVVD